jgi:hypothetical protein
MREREECGLAQPEIRSVREILHSRKRCGPCLICLIESFKLNSGSTAHGQIRNVILISDAFLAKVGPQKLLCERPFN